MKIYRCLKRHDLARIPSDFVKMERKIKKFKKNMVLAIFILIFFMLPRLTKREAISTPPLTGLANQPMSCLGKERIRKQEAAS
jgi:hypothetical protein